MTDFLQRFSRTFASLNKDDLDQLALIYSEDIEFSDPLHTVHGLGELRRYFAELYAQVSELTFEFHGYDRLGPGHGYLRWTMTYRHPRLASGKPVEVEGCSHLRWADKVFYHRDYFDAGALLYEHLPVFGSLIRWLKRRLQ